MNKNTAKAFRKDRRHLRVRKRVTGTPARPRLSIYKSLKHIHVQVIDDLAGRTLAACSSVESAIGKPSKAATAAAVGAAIAERAKAAGVTAVVLDRGGSRYHGRLKVLADAARKAGLSF